MPTSMGNISGGQREFIPHLVRAASACGINALFMEVHNNPSKAKSDPNTVLNIKYLERILIMAKKMHNERIKLVKKFKDLNVK
jgi:2-dehydro-3-deoxyphosphooctonate aldolase (KDO 8-P synthase)